ncbi:MAG TPA: alpha,alpha-trehalase TreF [Dongiaceae bacterium]|nr:alpha,alpha-trehalase TreF [Dongiaceae bacterium]
MARKIDTQDISNSLKAALVKTTGVLLKNDKDVDERLGELLLAVQKMNVYGDGKTFVDLVPSRRLKSIKEEYALVKNDPAFDLREFVTRHFYDATEGVYQRVYESSPDHTPLEHIDELWKFLERRNRATRGSLLALPYTYIVPGGRFNEQFYWDTYFIMLGLASTGKWKLIEGMMKNYSHEIRKYGYIPTANRTYLLSRSQPPFFSHMVRLLGTKQGSRRILREYLPYLTAEYRFWMKGRTRVTTSEHRARRRVALMPNGALLNRYYDNKTTPRPESLREDIETAELSGRKDAGRLYLHLRAAAESGWDFSSRWFMDPTDIKTIHTADIIPVDLNSLLYHLELTIADGYRASFNLVQSRKFKKRAKARAEAMQEYLWNEKEGFYKDYNFHHGTQTPIKSLAGVFPLYVGIATQDQADKVADVLQKEFLQPGGLVTTLVENGQQWDAPNGWAPLEWVAIQGLRNYGYDTLADDIAKRWTELNEKVYARSRKFVEKYNVESDDGLGGGGEYILQDGFGWTNGVYEALKRDFRP